MVQHPGGHRGVERRIRERERLDVAHARVDAAPASELDHAFRDVERDHLGAELGHDPGAQLAGSRTDLEQPARVRRGDRLEGDLPRIVAFDVLVDRPPRLEPRLGRVLGANDRRVVQAHRSMIGEPGAPLPGCFAPSQADTVAPTSPNSPFS